MCGEPRYLTRKLLLYGLGHPVLFADSWKQKTYNPSAHCTVCPRDETANAIDGCTEPAETNTNCQLMSRL